MASEELDPSAVRQRVLDDHRAIRADLERFQAMALALRDDVVGADALRRDVLEFLPRLEAHMALEDDILVPALLAADAFGDVRTEAVESHHQKDRATVAALQEALADDALPVDQLRGLVVGLVLDLYAEMADEDRTLLHADLLRDDLITSGVGG